MSNLKHLLLKKLLLPKALFLLFLSGAFFTSLAAEDDTATLNPSDIFFQAYLTIRDAEKLEETGQHSEAWQKYHQAAKYYDLLAKYHKNWKPHLVQGRIQSTKDAITSIEPKAAAEIADKNKRTRDLVEGNSNPSNTPETNPTGSNHERIQPPSTTTPKAPIPSIAQIPNIDPVTQSKLRRLEIDNRRLNKQLEQLRLASPTSTKEQQRLIKIINAKNREIGTLRDLLARAPLQQDMTRLAQRNNTLENELATTARALDRTKQKLAHAEKERLKHQQNATLMQNRFAKLKADMDEQKNFDNKIVNGLRQELKNLNTILQKTRQELGNANAQVAQMQRQLQQANATIQELTTERDNLKRERDTLASILAKNDSKGIRKLISENMRLGTELKQALDRLQYLEKSQDATKGELLQAKSDLAIAKTRIMRYQQEYASKNRTIQSLENRLRDAQKELSQAVNNPGQQNNAEEITMLRETVKRLIAAQERRKMAEKTLWEAYQKSGQTIANMSQAFADIRKTNIELSKEEQAMVAAARLPDSEFTSPERVSPAHAKAHGDALQQEIAMYTPLIKRFFEKGRYEAARETLMELDTRFPGHFPTLCKRGVVEIQTGRYQEAEEIFNEAITMRENSGYAHYMLGKTQYLLKDYDSSQKSFEFSLSLKSGNADAHLYLGNIAGAGKRYQEAEKHFQEAIQLNPSNSEAYFNLSVIYLQQNKKQEAQKFYRKALEHGAQPDPSYERKFS